jgi:hypothetical protein
MPVSAAPAPRRHRSIAALTRILPARQRWPARAHGPQLDDQTVLLIRRLAA